MAKDPTPRADQLRAQREARYGHLQATVEPKKPTKADRSYHDSLMAERAMAAGHTPPKPPRKRRKLKRKTS